MRKIILIVLVAFTFTTCEKDKYEDPLSKYRLKEYTKDEYRYIYTYNSSNKVEKSETYYSGHLIYITDYFYKNNSLDSLTMTTYHPEQYTTYKYMGDTILATNYRYSFNEKTAVEYVKSGNQVVKILTVICTDEGIIPYPDFYRTLHWENDNLVARYTYSNSGSQYPDYKSTRLNDIPVLSNSVLCEYDNHPNPLSALNEQLYFGAYESSKNNLLQMIVADMAGDTLYRIFTHTYNQDGLPLTTIETQKKNDTWLNSNLVLDSSAYTYKYESYK